MKPDRPRYHLAPVLRGPDAMSAARRLRVLLVSPAYRSHIVAPHLGLGYLATALRRAGHQVEVQDGTRQPVRLSADHDLIGVTAMTTYFPEACQIVRQARELGVPTIIGGPHVIADPEGSLVQSGADHACAGEGETTLLELAAGLPREQVGGLLWRDGDAIHRGPPASFHTNVDDFGQPAWDLIDPRSYPFAPHGMVARHFPLAPLITTRGCPYRCSYCSAPVTAGPRMRYRDPGAVVDEMEHVIRVYGVREIQIEDDNFTLKESHAAAICEEMLHRDVRVAWSLPNGVRIDRLSPDLLRLMRRAGCYLMALGIESANQRTLDLVDKKLDLECVRDAVASVVDSGIEAWGFFMIGFPGETRAEIENTIDFALSLPLSRVQFTRVVPLPGTPMYEQYRAHTGRDIDWSTFNYYEFEPDWCEVDAAEIGRLQRRGHLRFYARPRNLLSILSQLRIPQYRHAARRLLTLSNWRPNDVVRSSAR